MTKLSGRGARVEKVVAYATNAGRLLVFEHRDSPEAGLQVPAGTIKDGELPEEALLREFFEETGLSDVKSVQFLGRAEYDISPYRYEIQDRHFFHLEIDEPVPSEWVHYEIHDGLSAPTAFCLYWLKLTDERLSLAAGQGEFLYKLRCILETE